MVHPAFFERVKGVEPSSTAWKAEVLPLNYTRRQLKDTHSSRESASLRAGLALFFFSDPGDQCGNGCGRQFAVYGLVDHHNRCQTADSEAAGDLQ